MPPRATGQAVPITASSDISNRASVESTGDQLRMKAFYAILGCLLAVGWATAAADSDELVLGERNDRDFMVAKRYIFKPPIEGVSMYAHVGISARRGAVVTCVTVKNLGQGDPTATLVTGDVGLRRLVMLLSGKPGQGLIAEVKAYATHLESAPEVQEVPDMTPELPQELDDVQVF